LIFNLDTKNLTFFLSAFTPFFFFKPWLFYNCVFREKNRRDMAGTLVIPGHTYPKLKEPTRVGEPALCDLAEHGDPQAKVILQNSESYGFRAFPSHRAAGMHVLREHPDERTRTFTETILPWQQTHAYFDIDLKKGLLAGDPLPDAIEFEEAVFGWVCGFFAEWFGPELVLRKHLLVSTAHRQDKLSLHVVVLSVSLNGAADRERFRTAIKLHGEGTCILGLGVPVVDAAPYNSTQQLRGVSCNSYDNQKSCPKRNWLVPLRRGDSLAPWPSDELEAFVHGMVTRPPPPFSRPLPEPLRPLPPLPPALRPRVTNPPHRGVAAGASGGGKGDDPRVEPMLKMLAEQTGDRTSRVQRCNGEPSGALELYMCRHAEERCPHGRLHGSNSFYLYAAADGRVTYSCRFHPECRAPPVKPVSHLGRLETNTWVVPREQYSCVRGDLDPGIEHPEKPTVRDFAFDDDHDGIVESSNMGLGKTEAILRLIRSMPTDASILVVVHRRTLSRSLMHRLEGLHFELYDWQKRAIADRRLVIVVNSMHKIPRFDFDLFVVDEIVEVIAVMPHVAESWRVFRAMQLAQQTAKRFVYMSAQADHETRRFIELCDENARVRWCRNASTHPVSDLTYVFLNYADHPEHLVMSSGEGSEKQAGFLDAFYMRVCWLLDAGEHVAVAFSWQADLLMIAERLERSHPGKTVQCVHSGVEDDPKADAVCGLVRGAHYDCVMFTTSMDSGVSIENADMHYHRMLVCMRRNALCASTVMQMTLRFRRLVANEIEVHVDKTFAAPAGYTSRVLAQGEAPPAGAHTLHKARDSWDKQSFVRELEQSPSPVPRVIVRVERWFRFTVDVSTRYDVTRAKSSELVKGAVAQGAVEVRAPTCKAAIADLVAAGHPHRVVVALVGERKYVLQSVTSIVRANAKCERATGLHCDDTTPVPGQQPDIEAETKAGAIEQVHARCRQGPTRGGQMSCTARVGGTQTHVFEQRHTERGLCTEEQAMNLLVAPGAINSVIRGGTCVDASSIIANAVELGPESLVLGPGGAQCLELAAMVKARDKNKDKEMLPNLHRYIGLQGSKVRVLQSPSEWPPIAKWPLGGGVVSHDMTECVPFDTQEIHTFCQIVCGCEFDTNACLAMRSHQRQGQLHTGGPAENALKLAEFRAATTVPGSNELAIPKSHLDAMRRVVDDEDKDETDPCVVREIRAALSGALDKECVQLFTNRCLVEAYQTCLPLCPERTDNACVKRERHVLIDFKLIAALLCALGIKAPHDRDTIVQLKPCSAGAQKVADFIRKWHDARRDPRQPRGHKERLQSVQAILRRNLGLTLAVATGTRADRCGHEYKLRSTYKDDVMAWYPSTGDVSLAFGHLEFRARVYGQISSDSGLQPILKQAQALRRVLACCVAWPRCRRAVSSWRQARRQVKKRRRANVGPRNPKQRRLDCMLGA
jgi:hypothetical protein